MATATGDIASNEENFFGNPSDEKNMNNWVKNANKINSKTTKRYNELIGRMQIIGQERDGVVRRNPPKGSKNAE